VVFELLVGLVFLDDVGVELFDVLVLFFDGGLEVLFDLVFLDDVGVELFDVLVLFFDGGLEVLFDLGSGFFG